MAMEFSLLLNKVISHKAKIDNTKIDYNDNITRIENMSNDLTIANTSFKNTELGYIYLEKLINKQSEGFVNNLSKMLSYGVGLVFHDMDYKIEIKVSDKTDANIHLVYTNDEGYLIDHNIKQSGMGIRTVVGIMLQVYFIFHYKAEPILFVDEGFSAISEDYMPNFFAFISELAEKRKFKILLVTHDVRIAEYANKAYFISGGKAVEVRKEKAKELLSRINKDEQKKGVAVLGS